MTICKTNLLILQTKWDEEKEEKEEEDEEEEEEEEESVIISRCGLKAMMQQATYSVLIDFA